MEILLPLYYNCLVTFPFFFLIWVSFGVELVGLNSIKSPAQTLAHSSQLINIYWILNIDGNSIHQFDKNNKAVLFLGMCNLVEILY